MDVWTPSPCIIIIIQESNVAHVLCIMHVFCHDSIRLLLLTHAYIHLNTVLRKRKPTNFYIYMRANNKNRNRSTEAERGKLIITNIKTKLMWYYIIIMNIDKRIHTHEHTHIHKEIKRKHFAIDWKLFRNLVRSRHPSSRLPVILQKQKNKFNVSEIDSRNSQNISTYVWLSSVLLF